MHIISQDFDSEALKTKKHWNSFTTKFFIDAEKFLAKLEDKGVIQFSKEKYEEMLKGPLKCHKCAIELQNMPQLKTHIQKHLPSNK
jgi:aprataxin